MLRMYFYRPLHPSLICRLFCSVPTSRYYPISRHGVVFLRMDNANSSCNSSFASTVEVSWLNYWAAGMGT